MGYSWIVDSRHRLQAADLGDEPRPATITNVSIQGLEAARPVLHLAEFSKLLVLDPAQCNELARISHSALSQDWIGQKIMLARQQVDGEWRIVLHGPDGPRPARRDTDNQQRSTGSRRTVAELPRPSRRTLILLVLMAAIVMLAIGLEAANLSVDSWPLFGPPN